MLYMDLQKKKEDKFSLTNIIWAGKESHCVVFDNLVTSQIQFIAECLQFSWS